MTVIMGGLGPVPVQDSPLARPAPATPLRLGAGAIGQQPPRTLGGIQPNPLAVAPQAPPGGPATQAFGPGNNLIGQQIGQSQFSQGAAQQGLQQAGQNFQGATAGFQSAGNLLGQAAQTAQGAGQNLPQFQGIGTGQQSSGLNQAAQNQFQGGQLPGFQGIGTGQGFQPSQATAGVQGQALGQLGQALQAPGIGQAAQGQLQNILEQTADARQTGIQDIGRSAASFGRIGSGVVTTKLGDLESQLQRQQGQQFRQLASDTAQADAQNQLQRASLGLGALGQFQGQDLAQAGFQQGLRGEARGERGQEFGQGLAGAQFGLQQGQALQGLGAQQFGQQQALSGEARGERGAGLDDAFRRAQLQQQTAGALGQFAGLGGQLSQGLAGVGGQFQNLGLSQFDIGQNLADQQRGERGFQTGLDQQALDNRVRQIQLQQGLLGDERSFQLQQSGQLGQFGFGGQPISGGDLGVLQTLQGQATGGLQNQQQLASLLAQQPGQVSRQTPSVGTPGFNPNIPLPRTPLGA